MSQGQEIDSLYVKLGLKTEGFTHGLNLSTKELTGFATKVLGLIGIGVGIDKIVGYFKNLHETLADIGYQSRNLGVAGTEISKLGEVSALFGGKVDDARDSIEGLQSAIFNLKFNGQVSEGLAMMQRFGVAYMTAQGHMRDPEAIAKDAAAAIQRQAKVAGLDKGERFQLAQSFGFSGGMASAIAQGVDGFDKAWKAANKDQKSLSDRTIQGQVDLAQHLTRNQTAIDANSSVLLSRMTPAIAGLSDKIRHLADEAIPMIDGILTRIIGFIEHPPAWITEIEKDIKDLTNAVGPTGSLVLGIGGLIAALTIGKAATGVAGAAVGAVSKVALRAIPVVAAGIGLGYGLDKLDEHFGGHTVNALGNWMGGLFSRENKYDSNAISGVLNYKPPQFNPAAMGPWFRDQTQTQVPLSPEASSSGTTVTFENVTINSRGQDGQTLARDFVDGTKRRYLVNNADGGLR